MNVLLLLAHSIAEYDDLRMLSDLGYDVFSIGAYSDPAHPGDDKRPALPEVRYHRDLVQAVNRQRERHAGESDQYVVDWAKADLPDEVIEWADVIICHHFLDRWIVPQWGRIRHKRVIWRTCGQSDPRLEELMAPLHDDGLQIVRYAESERALSFAGQWAGQDALIYFGKYPEDYPVWTGGERVIGNVTQHMADRGDACGLSFYLKATEGLPAMPAGPGSEKLPGGIGELSYPDLLDYLSRIQVYLYTGTRPAPYTLGLLEAKFVGVPIVTMPAGLWLPELPELWGGAWMGHTTTGPYDAREKLAAWLDSDDAVLNRLDAGNRRDGIESSFGVRVIGPQWKWFLDHGVEATTTERMAMAAVA